MEPINTKQPLEWYRAQWRELEMILIENTELCKELGVHPETTARWRREGRVAYIKIVRKIYYRMSDVLPFLSRLEEIKGRPKNKSAKDLQETSDHAKDAEDTQRAQ